LNGDLSGASILRQAFGERKEAVVHNVPLTSAEAQALSEAHYKRIGRQFITGRGLAEPDARLRVGNQVDLKELGALFSGRYYLTSVRHLFDRVHGGRVEFMVERAGLGRA